MFGPPVEQRPSVVVDSHEEARTNISAEDTALGDGSFDVILFRTHAFPCRTLYTRGGFQVETTAAVALGGMKSFLWQNAPSL